MYISVKRFLVATLNEGNIYLSLSSNIKMILACYYSLKITYKDFVFKQNMSGKWEIVVVFFLLHLFTFITSLHKFYLKMHLNKN